MRTVTFAAMLTALGCAGGKPSGPAPDVTGVWAVTMRYEDGSCPDVSGGSQAAVWTVNRGGDGAYSVAVQGDEKLPTLTGAEAGSEVVLVGLAEGYPMVSTQWRLSGSTSKLTGRAIQARVAPDAHVVKTMFGESKKDVMCAVTWSVQADKQGG